MKTVSIVGARPQFIKLAPVSRAMNDTGITGGRSFDDFIVHTGQHYDSNMSQVFFDELDIPRPSINLEVGSGSHGAQTAQMLAAIESVLLEQKPDIVMIYGDTNSTLAGALAAAKLEIPIGHVEAGLRSFNRAMPEEINRIMADHVSDLLFAPTQTAIDNLVRENLAERAYLTGDVMLDAVEFNSALAEERSGILDRLDLQPQSYAVATLHRASNTDRESVLNILSTLNRVATEYLPIVFPLHPRTLSIVRGLESEWKAAQGLQIIEPLGYLDMLKLLRHARLALTDSGGLQKECFFLGTPCVTLRDETEWVETVSSGANVLTGTDPQRVCDAVEHWLRAENEVGAAAGPGAEAPFGDGKASAAIVREIIAHA